MIGKVKFRVVCYPIPNPDDYEITRRASADDHLGLMRCLHCSVEGLYWLNKAGRPVRGWQHKKGCTAAVAKKKANTLG